MANKVFENSTLQASFSLPEKPTVRQQLAYTSAAGFSPRISMLERHWEGVKALAGDWQCAALPDMAVDLDAVTDGRIADVITWAATQAAIYMSSLEEIPPNS